MPNVRRHLWLGGVILFLSAVCLWAAPKRVNVVFLLADDLGWTGLSGYGSDLYETPRLDGLARQGMKFTDAYAACTVCSPTRASIMTGLYPARLKLTDFIAGQNRPWAALTIPRWTKGLATNHLTVARALRDAGYATALVGKWHLDFPQQRRGKGDGASARAHGFDTIMGRPKGTRGFFLPKGLSKLGESGSEYLTDYLTDMAVAFIDDHQEDPFFLYMAYHTPHTPIQGRPDLVKAFEKKTRPNAIHGNPSYAAMVASLDQSVGRILDRLDRNQLTDRTLVIFTSDNGGLSHRYRKPTGFTSNKPLRAGKGSAYEGGVRVPAIIRLPGVTRAGSVCSEPIMSIDYFPTIMDVTGLPFGASPVTSMMVGK